MDSIIVRHAPVIFLAAGILLPFIVAGVLSICNAL
jgi:hypothetical protein